MAAKASGFVKVGQADYEAIMRLAFGRAMEKAAQANGQGDSSKPIGNEDLLYGALAGVGSGLLSDMMTPLDEDESPVKRALVRILHGAALGGVAGLGIRTVRNMRGVGGGVAPAASEKNAQATNSVPSMLEMQNAQARQQENAKKPWKRDPNYQVWSDLGYLAADPAVAGLGGLALTPLYNAYRNSRILRNRAASRFYTFANTPIYTVEPNSRRLRDVNPMSRDWRGVSPEEIFELERAYQKARPGPAKLEAELAFLRRSGYVDSDFINALDLGITDFNTRNPNHKFTSIVDAFNAASRTTPDTRMLGREAFGPLPEAPERTARFIADKLGDPYRRGGHDLANVHGRLASMAELSRKNMRKATMTPTQVERAKDIGKRKTTEGVSFKGGGKVAGGAALLGLGYGATRAVFDPHRPGGSWWDRLTTETEDRYQTDGGGTQQDASSADQVASEPAAANPVEQASAKTPVSRRYGYPDGTRTRGNKSFPLANLR